MPKYTQPRKTWQYTQEFKAKAVQQSLMEGIKVKQIAETLDIHLFMLSRWRKEYREGKVMGVYYLMLEYIGTPNSLNIK